MASIVLHYIDISFVSKLVNIKKNIKVRRYERIDNSIYDNELNVVSIHTDLDGGYVGMLDDGFFIRIFQYEISNLAETSKPPVKCNPDDYVKRKGFPIMPREWLGM